MKNLSKNILLSTISLFVFILLAELLTRIFWNPVSKSNTQNFGIILKDKNRSITYNDIEYKTNSYGIRNKEIKTGDHPDIFRIMALGDSYVWGDGLNYDDLITVKLEKLLNSDSKNRFQVINTGIGGFNAKDEYGQLIRLYPVYRPDFIIQFFFTNDILYKKGLNSYSDWKVSLNMWLRQNSKFYAFLYYLIKSSFNAQINVPKSFLPRDYFNLDSTKKGWVEFKDYTKKIINFCSKNNLGYCFVFIPTLTNLDENYPYLEMKNKVTRFINSLNVPFISLFELFSNYKPIELWVSRENTHWNGKATGLAAAELVKFLKENHLLKKYN